MSPAPAPAAALDPGTMVDHFRVLRLIGKGGMGEVYLARDTRLGRKVALKVVRSGLGESSTARERFLNEARATATFNHPHIVTIYDVGEHEGTPYVALEYLEGQTLRQRMTEDPLSQREALRVGLAIAQALTESHRHGVLHLDLKPDNVIMPRDGRLRVVDFGLAHLAGTIKHAGHASDGESSGSKSFGTPAYMAPELWQNDTATPAADIWSLGVVLYEIVAGHHPLQGLRSAADIATRWQSGQALPDIRALRDVPELLSGLIARTLETSPSRRPPASEVAAVLEALLGRPRDHGDDERGPFRGLFAFAERHADFFYGRDAEIASALERLRETPILAVVGRSGAGKSSFVQAGLVPRLREQSPWQVIAIRPGVHPLRALATRLLEDAGPTMNLQSLQPATATPYTTQNARPRALALAAEQRTAIDELAETLRVAPARLGLMLHDLAEAEQRRVLLFVDQLEEVVTLTQDPVERDAFLRALCGAADDVLAPVRVAFTVRDDFLSRLAETPEVRDVLQNVVVLRNLAGDALGEVLRRPLEATGYAFEDAALPVEILRSVQGEQATLPLLQFTLQILWERRDRNRKLLTRAAYESIGGVAGALVAHADEVLAGLSESQLAAVRDLLLRLVSAEGTRRTVGEAEALAGLGADAPPLLERLTQARLISSRKAQSGIGVEYELAHESLIQSWSRLARWLDDSRGEVRTLSETAQAAELWRRRERRPELLWSGDALRDARRAGLHTPGRVTAAIDEFLQASTVRETQMHDALARQRAHIEAESAKAAMVRGDLLHARAQVRTSLEVADSSEARSLWWQLEQGALQWKRTFNSSVIYTHFAPDGESLVVAADHNLYLLDAETLATRVLRGHSDSVVSCAFSPDGKHLASGTWSGHLGYWTLTDSAASVKFAREHTDSVWRVVFLRSSNQLLTASVDHSIKRWDLSADQPTVTHRYDRHSAGVYGLAVDPTDATIVSGGVDGLLCWWDLESGALQREQVTDGGGIRDVNYSPDGGALAVAMSDGTIHVIDAHNGERLHVLRGHTSPLHRAIFSPDGMLIASSSIDQTVRLWDASTGEAIDVLRGHGSLVRGLSFSPDGTRLASTSYDKTIRLWRLGVTTQSYTTRRRGHAGGIEGLAYSPTGELLATGSQDRTVRLWNAASGRVVHVLGGHEGNIGNVHFSPDGARIASACNDGVCRVFDVHSGDELMRLSASGDRVCAVAFHPQRELLATGHGDGSLRLWDLQTRSVKFVHKAHPSDCRWVQFSPDGKLLASTAHDDDVIVFWDVETGAEQRRLRGHKGGVVGVDFSRDQTQLVSAGFDETLRQWNLGTGESRVVGTHRSRVYKAMFAADQRHVATASADTTARIWNLDDGSWREFAGHASEVNAAKLAPSGAYLATASDDYTVRHWDTFTGRAHWRCPYVSADGVERFTHRGWERSDGKLVEHSDAAWRRYVADHARHAYSEGTRVLVDAGNGDLVLWDAATDQRVGAWTIPGMTQATLHRGAPIVIEGGALRNVSDSIGAPTAGGLRAIDSDGEHLILVGDRELTLVAADDTEQKFVTDIGATRARLLGDRLVIGFGDGFVEVRARGPGSNTRTLTLDGTPPSPVRRLLAGPMGTVVVGYASGLVGLWSLDSGTLLYEEQLHGAIAHLRWHAGMLIACSELGDDTAVDFSVFDMPYDRLRATLESRIAVVWENGHARRAT